MLLRLLRKCSATLIHSGRYPNSVEVLLSQLAFTVNSSVEWKLEVLSKYIDFFIWQDSQLHRAAGVQRCIDDSYTHLPRHHTYNITSLLTDRIPPPRLDDTLDALGNAA
ncbi:hypothetical protein CSKR_203844 [Clonorchis sinensis]|uniref:Uncharacterized protein n=1 Tax=Clonorchis sinensis TaxID=79923 RepID=A0A8T1N304_CLOSI|nr:hypothetical protein CSKR_203844 [Clonorchis sinensis]